ncbi:unnamed protein product [Onchocerca flexuosa]|uniref:G_PROTEIN_RECEP_F2_4 domain-containing protein n=1 Tax=Onchocerca flexuosa TaxID=387005 RepID=A0A183HF59_9BILA|nr:unnamed protein product [Onchocerca flexuosa]
MLNVMKGGRYAYELVGGYLKYVTLWVILFFELLAVGWFYCAHRLGKDLHTMLRPACCWCFGHFILFFIYLLPIIPAAVATLNLMNYDYSTYSSGIHEWKYSEVLGWAIALIPLMPIPLFMQFRICRTCIKGPGVTKWQKLKNAVSSPLPYEVKKSSSSAIRRYSNDTPGYVLLPQAPLAEPEVFSENYCIFLQLLLDQFKRHLTLYFPLSSPNFENSIAFYNCHFRTDHK